MKVIFSFFSFFSFAGGDKAEFLLDSDGCLQCGSIGLLFPVPQSTALLVEDDDKKEEEEEVTGVRITFGFLLSITPFTALCVEEGCC